MKWGLSFLKAIKRSKAKICFTQYKLKFNVWNMQEILNKVDFCVRAEIMEDIIDF